MQSNEYGSQLVAFTQRVSDSYSKAQQLLKVRGVNINQSGHIAELIWKEFLESWLPPEYTVVTRRFMSGNGVAPLKETDLLVLRPGIGDKYRYAAEVPACDVAAAFEVKLTLYDRHIRDAAAAAARNARLAIPLRGPSAAAAQMVEIREPHVGRAKAEVVGPIVFGLHSHSYKPDPRKKRSPFNQVTWLIEKNDRSNAKHPRECLDLVCVADMGSWIHYAHFMTHPATSVPGMRARPERPEQIETGYFPYIPIVEIPAVVALLASLLLHLDVANPDPMLKLIGEEVQRLREDRPVGLIREWPAAKVLTTAAFAGAVGVNQPFVIR